MNNLVIFIYVFKIRRCIKDLNIFLEPIVALGVRTAGEERHSIQTGHTASGFPY